MIAFVISLFTLIVSITPLTAKPASPFFDIDPDVVYVTNAISYIKRHQIVYTDHPGTPYILTLAASYTPLRFYAKFIEHTPFVEWSLSNFSFLVSYSRFFAALLFSSGLYLYLRTIKKYTKSNILTLLSWLFLFTYTGLFRFSVRLTPENLLPLIFALWFSCLVPLLNKNSPRNLILLNLISGLAFATKFTNLSFPIISGLVTLFYFFQNKPRKLSTLVINLSFIVLGFVLSTWVIKSQYPRLLSWTSGMATHSGIHGSGSKTFFDLSVYQDSINKLLESEPISVKLLVITPLLFLLSFFKFNNKKRTVFSLILFPTLIITLIFSKYSIFYYQLPNLFILSSLLVLILHEFFFVNQKIPSLKSLLIILVVILSLPIPEKVSTHLNLAKGVKKLAVFEQYVVDHPPKYMTLWQYGNSKDFSIIWGRSWSGEFYGEELSKLYPQLGEMINFKNYRSNKPEIFPLFDICWDQLYLQTPLLQQLLNNFPERNLKVVKLDYQDLTLVISNHCDTIN